jgi:hypothetical protein
VRGAARAETPFYRRTGITSVVPWLLVFDSSSQATTVEVAAAARMERFAPMSVCSGATPYEAALGGDHEAIRMGVNGLADRLLVGVRSVDVGRVDRDHAFGDDLA